MKVNNLQFRIPKPVNLSITLALLKLLLLIMNASSGGASALSRSHNRNWASNSTIRCLKEFIHVELLLTTPDQHGRGLPPHHLEVAKVYWQNMRIPIAIRRRHSDEANDVAADDADDPLTWCQPLLHSKGFAFKIPFSDLYKCGFTRVVNKLSGNILIHQDLIYENNNKIQRFPIKCLYRNPALRKTHNIVKRDTLPQDFKEDEDLEIIDTLEQAAPVPQLSMEVRQNGQLIDRMVNVIPGTPLIMEIKLNNESSQVYGIHVQYLEVSDGNSTSETILFRGCTVDPYLFDNFLLTPANTLQAKFRAFKFPNTPYVQFRANVRVCLRKCLIPHCLNGQGRSRRELSGEDEHLYEISLGVIMKIDDKFSGNNDELRKLESHVKELKNKNRILRDK